MITRIWRNLGRRLLNGRRTKRFHTLYECFELANDEIYTRSHGTLVNRAYRHYSQDGRLHRLENYLLQEYGIKEFCYVGSGDNAIVVQYAQDQAIRFRGPVDASAVNTQYVISSPFVCPVWSEVLFEGGRINFVPFIQNLAVRVSTGITSREIAEHFIFAILKAGFDSTPALWFYDYKNFDFKFEQVALLSDCTPVIIDHGAIILESDAPIEKRGRLEEDRRQCQKGFELQASGWDGSWFNRDGSAKISLLRRPKNFPDWTRNM